MTDDTKKDDALSKYGYDPLDDIKPIDTDDYRKDKDDTFIDPVKIMEELQKKGKAAPTSSLVKKETVLDADLREFKDQVFKGDHFNLTQRDPTMRQIMVGAGWSQRSVEMEPIDLDLTCFLLDKRDQTRTDEDFIFYNNPLGCEGAVKLLEDSRGGAGDGDDERIFIDINGLPFDIIRMVFAIGIYDPEQKGFSFSDVRDLYIRIFNYEDGQELARFMIPDDELAGLNGVTMAVMVREGPQWILQPLGEGVKGGLSPIARRYGLLIAEEAG